MSGSSCSRFSFSSWHVKFLRHVSVAVFAELASLHPETTLLLLSSFRWCHLYGPCSAEILYAVTKPHLGDFRPALLDGSSDEPELTLEGRRHAEAEIMRFLLRLASRRASLYIDREVERVKLCARPSDRSVSSAGRVCGACCVSNCSACAVSH